MLYTPNYLPWNINDDNVFQAMLRPPFKNIGSSAEFDEWYWSKEDLRQICEYLGLSNSGKKLELRERIIKRLELSNAKRSSGKSIDPDKEGDERV